MTSPAVSALGRRARLSSWRSSHFTSDHRSPGSGSPACSGPGLMTTFTPDGRARRSRYYTAFGAARDEIKMALGATSLGPDRLPGEAFTDQLHESVLA
jgi:hypothetical protein